MRRFGCRITPETDIADECADICILLMSITNRYGINLDEALRAKEAKNNHRTWK